MILYLIRHGQSGNNLLAEQIRTRYGEFSREAYNEYMQHRSPAPSLTPAGFTQAEHLAEYLVGARPKHRAGYEDPPDEETVLSEPRNRLGITRLYCSPMLRALQTAGPVAAALGLPARVWVALHEHGGVFDRDSADGDARGHPGLTRSQMAEQFPGYEIDAAVTEDGWWFGAEEDRAACHARAVRVAAELRRMAEELGDERIAAVSHGTFMDSLLKALLGRLPGNDFHMNHYNTGITRVDFTHSYEDGSPFLVIRYTNRVDHLPPELIT